MATEKMKQRTSGRKGKRLSPFAFRLWQEWKRLNLPVEDARVVVAVSGGADSVALFLALHELLIEEKLSLDLTIAHFNHGLRDEAGKDAEWVENLVKECGLQIADCGIKEPKTENRKPNTIVDFVLGKGDVLAQSKRTKDNLEQVARRARYDFLFDVALKVNASIVVTAHTMDDQAETVLLRLLRGSGTEGLRGIESVRQFKIQSQEIDKIQSEAIDDSTLQSAIPNPQSRDIYLVRPFLSWARRDETEKFCCECGVDFRLDAMNEDVRFSRVRVRKDLLPMMLTFNERIIESLTRTAEILREDDKELNSQAEKLLLEASVDDEEKESMLAPLRVNVLSCASVSLRRRALRLWIEKGKGDLRRVEMAHILQIEKLLEGEQGGRIVEIPKGFLVERKKGLILFRSQNA